MIKNRNTYPRYQVLIWYEDETADNGARLMMLDEFCEEEKEHAFELYCGLIPAKSTFNDKLIIAVRLEMETEDDSRCLSEKNEMHQWNY